MFPSLAEYERREKELHQALLDSEGEDQVILYVKKEKMKKVLPANRNVSVNQELLARLYGQFGEENVKAVEKHIENTAKMH